MRLENVEAPFEKYAVYKNFKIAEDRFYVTLVHSETKKHRIMSFARYVLSVKLGRELAQEEQADHIDNNKQNDSPGNLQILDGVANKRKAFTETGRSAKYVALECPECGAGFERKERYVRQRKRENRTMIFCSLQCSGAHSVRKRWHPAGVA